MPALSPAQVRSILGYRRDKTPTELAALFGVHVVTIKRILSGKTWKGIGE